MTPEMFQIVQNLGVAGFALYILWKMYDSSQKRFKEKDGELLTEIEKRDVRNDVQQKTFADYTTRIHESTTKQLEKNTEALKSNAVALSENTRIMQKVNDHLSMPHQPVIIQNNSGEKSQ